MPEGRSILSKAGRGAVIAFFIFVLFGLWQFIAFEMRPVDDFYQPRGYISKVNDLIQEGKLYSAPQKMKEGYRPVVQTRNFQPEDEAFYQRSWLKDDVDAFNDGDTDVFLIDRGKLQGVNIYRHRIESPLAADWKWWGRIYSQSSEGYAYLWNSRRTMKLYRPPMQERASAKAGQSEFREVVYGRGNLFQTGLGISIKGRFNNRIADVYSLGKNIVLKSYGNDTCFVNGHPVWKGQEQRLEEGDLVQLIFDRGEREEYLFHDFSQKPLSFVNVLNGRLNRTNLDTSFHLIDSLADAIETAVRKTREEKKVDFDVHLALDEDLSGLAQNALQNYARQLTKDKMRASCTIMNATNGKVLAAASISKSPQSVNENLKLHPVGSSTKIFLAAAAAQNYPDLLDLEIDPHPNGDEKDLLGYQLKEGYKLGYHAPFPGEAGRTNFENYIAKSCNRYHAILMTLSLAKDSALASGKKDNLFHGMALTTDRVDNTNGRSYLGDEAIDNRPDLSYFLTQRGSALESNNLESSELALNMERFFDVKGKYYEGSGEFFSPEPWNVLLTRLAVVQRPDLFPAFYPIMPQKVNLGFNLNLDFRLDFISIIFGGATNRWNNIKLAEAISRLVTEQKIEARFVDRIVENGTDIPEKGGQGKIDLNPDVHQRLLRGMEAVVAPGGTAGDLYPVIQDLKSRVDDKHVLEFYAKTGTPFRKEIRRGEEEIYSSVLLLTAILRDKQTGNIQDGLSFSVYIEDQGEHKAVDFMKQLLPRILLVRRWVT